MPTSLGILSAIVGLIISIVFYAVYGISVGD